MRVPINEIKPNPQNPRVIKGDKFLKLVKSIQDFPEMLELRPIVVDSQMIVLGGNMRLKACREAGLEEVPIIMADELTEEQKAEFIIKDNVGFGEWDWDTLANEWDMELLNEWGLDIPNMLEEEDPYTSKIEAPIYEPSNLKPPIEELVDGTKTRELYEQIEKADIDPKEKEFLRLAAQRHLVFNYSKIADYYAHSPKEVQELMQNSALVIIDFDKAIENGFVELTKNITKQFLEDYGWAGSFYSYSWKAKQCQDI